ncbi:MAG TPA: hypothetical protein VMH78_09110 [Thermoplasmata archaeon]|nr:hypothetical protein [Thermoplasmata archaeon]
MRAAPPSEGAGPPGRRCRCGHYPVAHMRVVPAGEGGGCRLSPVGPCERCGAAVCSGYVPAAENGP